MENKYRITISFNLTAIDDMAARMLAQQLQNIFLQINPDNTEKEIKLQRIFGNKPPEKIEI